MLYTFRSSSAADVIMQRFNAEKILSIIGKNPGKVGVITVSEMDEMIQKIESEIERQEQGEQSRRRSDAPFSDHIDVKRFQEGVVPFLELLRTSKTAGSNVVWGL